MAKTEKKNVNHARRIFQYSLVLIAPLRPVEIRVDARVRSFFAQTVQRGFAYGFSFNTHLASRERKTRSRSRKVIFPLASLDRRESLQAPPFQLGGSSIESWAFLLFICRCRAHQPYLADETKKKGNGGAEGRGLSCIERGKQLIRHRRRPGIHSHRSQIKCHSPRRQPKYTMRERACPSRPAPVPMELDEPHARKLHGEKRVQLRRIPVDAGVRRDRVEIRAETNYCPLEREKDAETLGDSSLTRDTKHTNSFTLASAKELTFISSAWITDTYAICVRGGACIRCGYQKNDIERFVLSGCFTKRNRSARNNNEFRCANGLYHTLPLIMDFKIIAIMLFSSKKKKKRFRTSLNIMRSWKCVFPKAVILKYIV